MTQTSRTIDEDVRIYGIAEVSNQRKGDLKWDINNQEADRTDHHTGWSSIEPKVNRTVYARPTALKRSNIAEKGQRGRNYAAEPQIK